LTREDIYNDEDKLNRTMFAIDSAFEDGVLMYPGKLPEPMMEEFNRIAMEPCVASATIDVMRAEMTYDLRPPDLYEALWLIEDGFLLPSLTAGEIQQRPLFEMIKTKAKGLDPAADDNKPGTKSKRIHRNHIKKFLKKCDSADVKLESRHCQDAKVVMDRMDRTCGTKINDKGKEKNIGYKLTPEELKQVLEDKEFQTMNVMDGQVGLGDFQCYMGIEEGMDREQSSAMFKEKTEGKDLMTEEDFYRPSSIDLKDTCKTPENKAKWREERRKKKKTAKN
jgi:hypothetical protein